jgi:transposase
MVRPLELPDDIESLKRLVLESIEAAEAARAALIIEQLKVEKLRFEIARFKRSRYGRSSEQLAQLELSIEDLEASHAALPAALQAPASVPASKPVRKGLPTTLPREEIVHAVACTCTTCGGPLRPAGEDVAEMLEWIPARYKVIRHIRPKFACERCEILVQAPAPTRPIARGLAGPGLLAHVLVSKFADHLPLYRQSQIFARDGIDLERSTLADWARRLASTC